MEILVFKTNVPEDELYRVDLLLKGLPGVKRWNFDLDDCDKILRIEAVSLMPDIVESLLHSVGIDCRLLDY